MHEGHPETAEKLLAGLEKILAGLSAQVSLVKGEWA